MPDISLKKIVLVLLLAVAAAGAGVFIAAQKGNDFMAAQKGNDPDPAHQIESTTSRRSVVDAPAGYAVDEKVPDFELETLNGDSFRLSRHLGQVVVVNFWATWCAPCRVEIPDLIEMQEELQDEGVRFVGISLDFGGMDVVREFANEAQFNYPIAIDDGEVAEKFGGVYALPTTFVIDREGIMRRRIPGLVSKEVLQPLLRELAD